MPVLLKIPTEAAESVCMLSVMPRPWSRPTFWIPCASVVPLTIPHSSTSAELRLLRRAPVLDEVQAPHCCAPPAEWPDPAKSVSTTTSKFASDCHRNSNARRGADSRYWDTWRSALMSAFVGADILRRKSLVANARSGRSSARSFVRAAVELQLCASASSSGVSSPSPSPFFLCCFFTPGVQSPRTSCSSSLIRISW